MAWRNYTDTLQNRHASWTGEIIRDTRPDSPDWNKCFQVTHSYRDPNTGDWSISWDNTKPLDRDRLPRGTKVYEADGQSWDMRMEWYDAFPKIDFWVCTVLSIALIPWAMVGRTPGQGFPMFEALIGWALIWAWFVNTWVFKREPVRGTRIALGMIAVHEAYAASHADERARDQAMVPQWQGNDPNYQPYRPYYQPPDPRDLWVAGRGTQPRLHANGMWYWTDHLARDHWSTQRPTGV